MDFSIPLIHCVVCFHFFLLFLRSSAATSEAYRNGQTPPLCFSTELAEGLNVRDEVIVFDGF